MNHANPGSRPYLLHATLSFETADQLAVTLGQIATAVARAEEFEEPIGRAVSFDGAGGAKGVLLIVHQSGCAYDAHVYTSAEVNVRETVIERSKP